eukprot:239084_1
MDHINKELCQIVNIVRNNDKELYDSAKKKSYHTEYIFVYIEQKEIFFSYINVTNKSDDSISILNNENENNKNDNMINYFEAPNFLNITFEPEIFKLNDWYLIDPTLSYIAIFSDNWCRTAKILSLNELNQTEENQTNSSTKSYAK